jgi:TetR/AcrR family transcriptional repressor of nem operon
MVQETYDTHPRVRDACGASIRGHAATLVEDIGLAIEARGLGADWSAEGLALHTQAVIQGAFILAKATGETAVADESLRHLHRDITLLFEDLERRN